MALLKESIFINTEEEARFTENLVKLKLGNYTETEYFVCKKCKSKKSKEDINLSDDFWSCQNAHVNSVKHSEKRKEKKFTWDFKAVNKAINDKLNKISTVSDKVSHWIISVKNGKLPVTIIDSPLTSSAYVLLNQYKDGVLLLYLFDDNRKELQNVFIAKNFISVQDFVTEKVEKLKEMLELIKLNYDVTQLINAEEEIEKIKVLKQQEQR